MTGKAQPVEATGSELSNDPNCTITITPQGGISYYPDNVADNNISDAQSAIDQLTFFDLWKLPPFRIDCGSVRLAVMGAIAGGGRTWQVQIIKGEEGFPISSVLVQGNLVTASTDERRDYVQKMARNALNESLSSRNTMDMTGPCK